MFIKHIVWRKLIYGQVRRLTLGMKVPANCTSFKKLKADHALEWGEKNQNPSVWCNFVNEGTIPITPDVYTIPLDGCRNDLKLWQGENPNRGSKIKISQRLWSHPNDIIEVWYLGCMNVLNSLLKDYNDINPNNKDSKKLYNFVNGRLSMLNTYSGKMYDWAKETQEQFKNLGIDNPNFLFDEFFTKTKTASIEQNYLVVMCFEDDNGQEKNHAIMLNIKDGNLHPILRDVIVGDCGSQRINKRIG